MISEKEAVMRERAAFVAGVKLIGDASYPPRRVPTYRGEPIDKLAASKYPMPRVTRPRVVRDPEWDDQWWKAENGKLQFRIGSQPEDCWYPYLGYKGMSTRPCGTGYGITLERVRVWADLLANPTEEVEDDA